MVNEREPPRYGPSPKDPQHPLHDRTNEPEFGRASPMRNPLNKPSTHIFNIPKAGQKRPEHHRAPTSRSSSSTERTATSSSNPLSQVAASTSNNQPFQQPSPSIISVPSSSPDFVEISRPDYFPPAAVHAAPRSIFSTANPVPAHNLFKAPHLPAPPTRTGNQLDGFNPDQANYGGSFDPTNFMDAAKADESIKALLEGAFEEDDDDKPRTRLRKQNKVDKVVDSEPLSDKLQELKIGGDPGAASSAQANEDEDDGTVEGLKVKLLPHQIDGVAWMLDKEIGTRKKNGVLPNGGILADDMGLGKTIQALALIMSNRRPSTTQVTANPKLKIPQSSAKTTLVVAPLALLKQWESEIKDKILASIGLKVLIHHGPSRTKNFKDLERQDIVITTYQTLTSEHEASGRDQSDQPGGFFGIHWYRVILDEAHSIKNRNAKMTKAAYALQSVYRWCLTGTPMQNNLDELQSLIRFLDIKPYNEFKTWKEQIVKPMKNGRGGLAMKRLQYFLKAFMKRRTKEVLKKEGALTFGKAASGGDDSEKEGFKIVARSVKAIEVQFSSFEREFYENLEARTNKNLAAIMESGKNDYIGALVLLLRLRQACNHPELSRGSLSKEKESLPSDAESQRGSPSKSSRVDEMDDVADLFGNMTVQTKKCDTCGSELSPGDIAANAIRCTDCNDDFDRLRHQSLPKEPKNSKILSNKHVVRQKRAFHSRRILESDEEDDDDDDEDSVSDESYGNDGKGSEDDSQSELRNSTKHRTHGSNSVMSAKIHQLVSLLKEESDEHKFIVFSEFTSMLDLVEPFLQQQGLRFARYDGKMKNDDREASLDRLRKDSRTRILLCSLRCGSLGLNLTAASRVVIMEPFWNPFVEEQAIDRVHRLNQTQDVVVYRLTIVDSVEERILALQERKRQLAKAALEGGKDVGKLHMEDVLRLFKLDAEYEDRFNDNTIQPLGRGTTSGVLMGSTPKAQLPSAGPVSKRTGQQSPRRGNAKPKPKFTVPESLRAEYEALYGRRW